MIPGITSQIVTPGGGGGPTDPYWANVGFLLQPAGPDGSTSFVDVATAKTITVQGAAEMDTAVTIYSPATLKTTIGGGSDGIDGPDSPDWAFGAGEFTVETFIHMASAGANMAIMGQWGGGPSWFFYVEGGTLKFRFFDTGDNLRDVDYVWSTRTTGVTYHLAATRDGSGDIRLFIDGVLVQTTNRPQTMKDTLGFFSVGYLPGFGGYDSAAYFDQVRITKGVCRYVANFTPPTAAFPTS